MWAAGIRPEPLLITPDGQVRRGLFLTQLATASVRSRPAVTSVIIGPRTAEQIGDLLTGPLTRRISPEAVPLPALGS
jgi:aryl-alcohol dehydrogenase-like predicted oxidoreductase